MATVSDISQTRRNVNELDDSGGYTDVIIGNYIDELGVAGASAKIWGEKAASYQSLVDVTEAGATHKFSDLYKSALAMQDWWTTQVPSTSGSPKVRVIERS